MTISLFDQSSWIALITGSTQALGKAAARDLAEHCAHVIISSQKEMPCNKIMDASRNDGLGAECLALNFGH